MSDRTPIALVTPRPAGRRTKASGNHTLLRRSALPLLLLLIWTAATLTGLVSQQTLPSPLALGRTMIAMWRTDDLGLHLLTSLGRVAGGAAIGISLGLALGLIAGLWRLGEEGIDATLQMIRTIPFLALVPLFIVWFGIGEAPKTILIALASLAPMYLNSFAAVRNVDPRLVEAMRSYGLTGLPLVTRVIIPMAAPGIFTGLRFALGTSVLVLIAAEQINSMRGLGFLLNMAQIYQRVDIILICILIYALLGILTDLAVRGLEHGLLPWRRAAA